MSWETNSKILGEKYPGLLEAILKDIEGNCAEDLKIEIASSGAVTLLVNSMYVHSARDPVREGQRLAQSINGSAAGSAAPVIVLGFGLGYAAQAVADAAAMAGAESEPPRPIIIVEKNLRILRLAFEKHDLSRLLCRKNVVFVPGGSGEGIISALSIFEKNTGEKSVPQIVRNRTLTSIDEQWYSTVENRIRAWTMRDDVNLATLKKFGRRWVNNLSRNMDAIRDLPGISRLASLAGGGQPLPVFLAAAGPSLDNMAAMLPEIYKRCIIVAVDTSLGFMLKNGVDPDFTLVVDPQFWNSRHLDCMRRAEKRRAGGSTCLIIESAVYPPVLRLPSRGMYLCGSLFPLGKFIEQRVDPKGELGAGGSVATTAWDFARTLEAQQIWIAGLDLAYPGLKTHFHGARFEENALAESCRLNPVENWLANTLRGGIPFRARAMSGGQVLTDHRLSFYAAWFENRFRQYPIRNYSLSPDGLAISGLEPAAAEAVLALPLRREEIDKRLAEAFSRIEEDFFEREAVRQRAERYDGAIAALRCGLEKISAACKKGETIAAQALRNPGAAYEKALAALDEINQFISCSEVKDISGFLFPPDALAEADNTGGLRAYLQSSITLYRSLAKTADNCHDCIKRL